MNKKGFTLIELVIVIVILGILAAVAVPKFVGLTKDAKVSAVKGFAGSLRAAANIVHAKWLVEDNNSGSVDLEGTTVCVDNGTVLSGSTVLGYPLADNDVTGSNCDGGISKAVNFDNNTFIPDNATNCTVFYYKGTSDTHLKSAVCDNSSTTGTCDTTDCGVVYFYDGKEYPNIVACTDGCK